MKTLLAAAVAAIALAGVAGAQPRGPGPGTPPPSPRGPSITLFEGPNYQGQSRTFTGSVENLADQGFNDRSQSLRVQGRWRLCEDARLRGRCAEVSGDVPNLDALHLTGQVSSFESLDRVQEAGPGGYDRRPYEGGGGFDRGPYAGGAGVDRGPYDRGDRDDRRDFAGPRMDGAGVSFFPRPMPGPYRDAQDFCRRLGFSGVAYSDGRGREIRDVVCRR